jgi:hypothetical protein
MKILCLCSALDLAHRYGCTPAWWQLFKGLYEQGHDVIAVPYQGAAVESPWWRVYPNPCRAEGAAFAAAKKYLGAGATSTTEGVSGKVSNTLIESWIRPRWQSHLEHILEQEGGVDAVVVFTIPLNHFTGLPEVLRKGCYGPIVYYDGDTPASLPSFGGFASGFRIYDDADLTEYDGFVCNSKGGAEELRAMGARRVETVHWWVDPDLYAPVDVAVDRDVFFYGFGSEYREEWFTAMLAEPSTAMPEHHFAIGGQGFKVDLGNTQEVGDVPFSVFRQAACRSRINLNITRDAHASVFASSSMRPFELAAMGCCIVSNPYHGLESWFDIGNELLVVDSAGQAIDTYRDLLTDDTTRAAMGAAARERVLAEHTHHHRVEQLIGYLRSF